MASYLWQRGGTWFFQLRPPNDSRLLLGATPVRVHLPFRTHREAIRCARHLAGMAERWLMMMRYRGFARMRVAAMRSSTLGEAPLSREEVKLLQAEVRRKFVNTLVAEVEQLTKLSDEFLSLEKARKNSNKADEKVIAEAQKALFERSMSGWNSFATEVITDFDTVFADIQGARESSHRLFEELDDLSESYKYDGIEWRSQLQTITAKAKQFETEGRLAHKANSNVLMQVGKAMKDNAAINERLLYEGPLLSVVVGEFLAAKRKQLPEGSREVGYFEHRIRTFLEIVGDKQIAAYTEGDLTSRRNYSSYQSVTPSILFGGARLS